MLDSNRLKVKYLGLPMTSSYLSHTQCMPIIENIKKKVNSWKKTLFWKDPWHPKGILMEWFSQELLYDSTLNKDAKVSSIIRENAWSIPQSIGNLLDDTPSYLIDVELDASKQDEVLWNASSDGQFQMRDTYNAVRKRHRTLDWASIVWFKGNIPRHSFITWVLSHRALKTLSKLKKWGTAQHDLCPLCNQDIETEKNIFFECTYSQHAWIKMLYYLSYSRQIVGWEEEIKWCTHNFKGNSISAQLKKVTLYATVYYLWTERNNRLYQQQYCTCIELVKRIYNDVRLKFSVGELIVEDSARNRQIFGRLNLDALYSIQKPIKCSWTKLTAGWYKLNSDGSLRGNTGGYGAVIRDDQGDVVAAFSGSVIGHSVIKHEQQGVEARLKLANSRCVRKLEISTDLATVCAYLTTTRQTTWDIRHTISGIRRMLSALEDHIIKHEYRETNRVADIMLSTLEGHVLDKQNA